MWEGINRSNKQPIKPTPSQPKTHRAGAAARPKRVAQDGHLLVDVPEAGLQVLDLHLALWWACLGWNIRGVGLGLGLGKHPVSQLAIELNNAPGFAAPPAASC